MNFNFPAVCGVNISSNLKYKTYKKRRHKRRKNKFKNSRRKNPRKFCTMNGVPESNHSKSKKLQFTNYSLQQPFNSKLTSNWYWANYAKAFDWHCRQDAAHWRACAVALQEENKYLTQIIKKYLPDLSLNMPIAALNRSNKVDNNVFQNNSLGLQIKAEKSQSANFVQSQIEAETDSYYHSQSSEEHNEWEDENQEENKDEDEEVEFEMSEEMIKFFEESFKHKMNFKKQEEKLEKKDEISKKVTEIKNNRLKRSTEMELLYGDDASKIIGMETAVQLSFDRYCDTKSPKYWPNIPLKL